ncbi:MAG: preprotein translocase subunit SecG [Atopobiaceae bacterium]|nr:preprotein translocase subunit SecG [Atopobiaceae bacterium]MBQ6521750.1 preprotein translocase subunit SecG [Atopobiaceae bacterium]MBQ9621109.1 preprotein translocase subunit SecG [Atopobiaceae bacterium]MCR4870659.1 preprotein translocase subunit SecG [Atopobiaceae bacterium]
MGFLNVLLVIVLVLSGIATVLLVLMHSGKGTGLSEMISASVMPSGAGTGIVEKNLDRLTVITAVVFGVCICILALTFPVGTIG